ncbi:unnamed protein product [Paramecium primaurelia]|uniref:Protein kinase domain-containing protein n=1 Tax=Paramecium primaurelia TaxID=5886 RepID=A0A8S1QMJ5_PARPR|nr:unnamed protein product [Paramecium primaurelia]
MQIQNKIGEGLFGQIHKCLTVEGDTCAIKIYKEECPKKLREKEIKILQSISHTNIQKIVKSDCEYKWFITELMNQDLYSVITKRGILQQITIKQILLQLCNGLTYLHSIGYVHRDIKLENVMLSKEPNLKIIDFGLSVYIESNKLYPRHCGTPTYMAPELNLEDKLIIGEILKKSDVFALGVLIFILCYGCPPFTIAKSTECKFWQTIEQKKWQTFWNYFDKKIIRSDQHFKDLIQNMLDPDHKTRFTIEQVKQHQWMNDEGNLNELL